MSEAIEVMQEKMAAIVEDKMQIEHKFMCSEKKCIQLHQEDASRCPQRCQLV